jgi:hypothetical protein
VELKDPRPALTGNGAPGGKAEQEENDDLNVGAAQEAKYHAANLILKHIISSRWSVQERKLLENIIDNETMLYQAILTEIMRQPRPPQSKNGLLDLSLPF